MVDLLADRALYTWYDDEASPTLEVLRLRYARQAAGVSPDGLEGWHTWILRERDSGRTIGFAQATVSAGEDGVRSAELAWVVGTAWQGRGFATEAATAIRDGVAGVGSLTGDDVAHVHAHIAPGHTASETVARRAGLSPTDVTHEGEIRWELAQTPH